MATRAADDSAQAPDTYLLDVQDGPTLFDSYETETTEQMSQDLVDTVMDEWDDRNSIHAEDGLGTAYAEVTGLFGVPIPVESTIVPGATFAYEAVRQAEQPVEEMHAEFMQPVDTTNAVALTRETTPDGETVTVERPDLTPLVAEEVLETTATSTVDMTYGDTGDNAANAYKVAGALGLADHEGDVLLNVDASFNTGYGEQQVVRDHTVVNPDPGDRGFDIATDTYLFADGTEVTFTLLELDEDRYDAVRDTFHTEYTDPDTDLTTAYGDMMQAYQDLAVAQHRFAMETMTFPWRLMN